MDLNYQTMTHYANEFINKTVNKKKKTNTKLF